MLMTAFDVFRMKHEYKYTKVLIEKNELFIRIH